MVQNNSNPPLPCLISRKKNTSTKYLGTTLKTLTFIAVELGITWLVSPFEKFHSLSFDTPHNSKVTILINTDLIVCQRSKSQRCTFGIYCNEIYRALLMHYTEQRAGWYWLWELQPHTRTLSRILSATLTLRDLVTNDRYDYVLVNILTMALWRVSNESEKNFVNDTTSHDTPTKLNSIDKQWHQSCAKLPVWMCLDNLTRTGKVARVSTRF